MALLTINTKYVLSNIKKLVDFLEPRGIKWSFITKVLCGDRKSLEFILNDDIIKKVDSVGDSRILNLKTIKEINPGLKTMFIKPARPNQAKSVVKYADISLNTSLNTIKAINEEAKKQGKIHKIIVMIELGELREGILRDNIVSFYESIFELDNIEVNGLGTNLGCMYGVEPSYDKLVQLCLYKLLIEEKFKKNLDYVSAGSSITLPLVNKGGLPKCANHLRLGESAFLGNNLLNGKKFRNLSMSAFDFAGEIVELETKSTRPDGNISDANVGHVSDDMADDSGEQSETLKALADFGHLDVDVNNLAPKDENVKFIGTTSDVTVYDVGKSKKKFKVGGQLHFKPSYMAVARLMNSNYVRKAVK